MMKYLCLAYEEEEKLNALSKSEWDELRNETLTYLEELQKRGYVIAAQALQKRSSRYHGPSPPG
jgi:hypothetical protein